MKLRLRRKRQPTITELIEAFEQRDKEELEEFDRQTAAKLRGIWNDAMPNHKLPPTS